MFDRIFEGHGIEIFHRDGRFVLRYLTGRWEQPVRDVWISPEQALHAQRGECEAYDVIFQATTAPVCEAAPVSPRRRDSHWLFSAHPC